MESLASSAEMAAESLRLTHLRYQAGESTVLEVVDAQNTLTHARNAYDDGQSRYRVRCRERADFDRKLLGRMALIEITFFARWSRRLRHCRAISFPWLR